MTSSSNDTRIGDLELPLASKSSEFDTAAAEFESTKFRLHFPEDAVSLFQDQVKSQKPWLREVECAQIALEVAWAAVESNVQSFTASESTLQG